MSGMESGKIMSEPVTVIDLWSPKYFTTRGQRKWEFWPACYRVEYASTPMIEVVFSKAKHMKGLAFRMNKSDLMQYPRKSNGSINCFAVPMDDWKPVQTKIVEITDPQKMPKNIREVFFEKQLKLL
jgi:hypothetical protein